jgi:hypothetical protein
MRLLVLGCVVFMVGAGFGFYEAHAASGIKYDGYLLGKNISKASPDFLSGYAAGTYDTLETVTYIANEVPKVFNAETFTKQYQCLQKIPTAQETVAFGKDFWTKEPDVWAAQELFIHACEYGASARSNTMTKGGGRARVGGGQNNITMK